MGRNEACSTGGQGTLGISTHPTKRLDQSGKAGCGCPEAVCLGAEKLGEFLFPSIHRLREGGGEGIISGLGSEEVWGELKGLKQPPWRSGEGAGPDSASSVRMKRAPGGMDDASEMKRI